MDKNYDHTKEGEIYKKWEESGAFAPKEGARPYTILMPPPNANASLHAGHAMYTIDDVLIRWKRMQGLGANWLPGTDHAGFETQFVYEKHLAKEGKSRLDFDRQTLYSNIYKFVQDNSGLIYNQFRRLGFSANWEKGVFTLDEHVLAQAWETFTRMEGEGLVYRDNHIVNFCTHCGTSLAELEVEHEERTDPLYFMKYGPFVLATVRPETKFGDTAVAVHSNDKRYKKFIGQEIEVEGLIGNFTVRVIADKAVDPKFGTGVVKVTPAHDPVDFEMGKRHGLEIKQVIDLTGKLNEKAGKYAGLKVAEARKVVAGDLQKAGLLEKVDENYVHTVSLCYRCKRILEPMVIPNWFIKVENLKKPVIAAVQKNKIKFYPKRFKKHMLDWLKIMHDWPISRQIAWGIRIPVWYKVDPRASNIWVWWLKDGLLQQGNVRQFLDQGVSLSEIEKGLQKVHALTGPDAPSYVVSVEKPGEMYLPETDTFDTWFSSGQWPLVTGAELPTDVLGTLADILKFWVSRMIMFSLYIKKETPFKDVYLWSMVADAKGVKMSKSKGNVVNPIDLVDRYGADALRMALLYGVAPGSAIPLAEDKVRGMRNFSNKLWNIARFIQLSKNEIDSQSGSEQAVDQKLRQGSQVLTQKITENLNKYRLGEAAEDLYQFVWHTLADDYIEDFKSREDKHVAIKILEEVFTDCIKLLHPFMPFVTEAVWAELGHKDLLITASWPV